MKFIGGFKNFFLPSIYLMGRLRIPEKFLLISALFILPAAVSSYFLISEINTNVRTTRQERIGLDYINPVRFLLQDVQQHRGLVSAYLNGEESFLRAIEEKQVEISQDFIAVEALDAQFDRVLKTSPGLAALKKEWHALDQDFKKGVLTPEDSFRKHTTLTQNIVFFISHIGDTSHLILDPDLDTYYLMDAVVNRIPSISERLGQARAFGLTIPRGQSITDSDKRLFLSVSALADFQVQVLNRGMKIVFEDNPAVGGRLDQKLLGHTGTVNTFLQLVDERIIQADRNQIDPREYYAISTAAIDRVFSLYDDVAPVLHELLQKRIDTLLFRQALSLSIVSIILLIEAYLFAGFYLSVRRLTDSLRQMTEHMIRGGASEPIALETRDELSEVVVSFNDIARALAVTNEKLVEDIEERKKFQLAVEQAYSHIVITDANGKILYANPAAVRMTGYSLSELIGGKFSLWWTEMPPEYYEKLWQVLQVGKKTFVGELVNRRKNGEVYQVSATISPIVGDDGMVRFFVALERDITEEKALESARTNFISIASHQLRTPLTSIRWFSEMLMEGDAGELTKDQKRFVEPVYRGTKQMIDLINLLLQLARVEAGKLSMEPVVVFLPTFIQEVVNAMQGSFAEKEQQVIIKTGDDIKTVMLDKEFVWQVLQNLMSNAQRYSKPKSEIVVYVKKMPEFFQIAVQDSGIGIPQNEQSRIFEKFFRASNAAKFVPDGSGLGLALVHALVEEWGGSVWFESQEGKGTTFFFTIPVSGTKPKEHPVRLLI